VPFFGRLEWFDPVTWQADLRRIQRFYEANGYYQARVLEDVVTEVQPKHVQLLVKLRGGSRPRVLHLPLGFVLPAVGLAERMFLRWMPLTAGQLAAFRNDSTAQDNELARRLGPQMKTLEAMCR
jgi:translocation and assembly module TamA